jgi:hypothetical protein
MQISRIMIKKHTEDRKVRDQLIPIKRQMHDGRTDTRNCAVCDDSSAPFPPAVNKSKKTARNRVWSANCFAT